jgi:hypothetical protein
MFVLNERELRRPEFSEGHKAVLADGQEWTFPRPVLRFRPVRDKDAKFGMGGDWGHDLEYRRLRDALVDCDQEQTFEMMSLQLQIAANLLLRNYALSDDQLGTLVYFDFDDPANATMWEGLTEVIFASPPKPLADGSAVA